MLVTLVILVAVDGKTVGGADVVLLVRVLAKEDELRKVDVDGAVDVTDELASESFAVVVDEITGVVIEMPPETPPERPPEMSPGTPPEIPPDTPVEIPPETPAQEQLAPEIPPEMTPEIVPETPEEMPPEMAPEILPDMPPSVQTQSAAPARLRAVLNCLCIDFGKF